MDFPLFTKRDLSIFDRKNRRGGVQVKVKYDVMFLLHQGLQDCTKLNGATFSYIDDNQGPRCHRPK